MRELDSTQFEKVFFLYLLDEPKLLRSVEKSFFYDEQIGYLAYISREFYEEYREPPTKESLKFIVEQKFQGKVDPGIVDAIFDVDINQYNRDWLERTSESWIKLKSGEQSLVSAVEYLQSTEVTPENVDHVIGKVQQMVLDKSHTNFDDDLGSNFFDPQSHQMPDEELVPSPHVFYNEMCEGYAVGDLVVYLGEPSVGKSLWMANDAASYITSGYDVGIVSAEMREQKFVKRMGANLFNVPIKEYDRFAKDEARVREKLADLKSSWIPPGNNWVKRAETGSTTVLDIEEWAKDLEEKKGIKLKVLMVDYLNILKDYRAPNAENMYLQIKHICEDLRAMGQRNGWVIITAAQLNRGAIETSDFGMSDVAESAGLTHTADVLLGLIQDPTMYQGRHYWLKVVKNRDGEGKNLKIKYNVSYEYMRLRETEEVQEDG